MRGIVLVNAYIRAEGAFRQAERMREELAARGLEARIEKNGGFLCSIEGGEAVLSEPLDFCVYLDKDKYLSRMLEKCGVRLFNSARAVELCDDKMLTCLALAGQGIPMPKTLPGILCYRPEKHVFSAAAARVEAAFSYPIVVKLSYGSLGRGERLVHDRSELLAAMEEVRLQPHLFQEFVAESAGRDLRVVVVGEKVLGGMMRVSDGDFRSNLGCGGHAVPHPVDDTVRALSLKIARILHLDYCGIDYLFGKDGPVVCEVNSNAFFGGFERVTGVNVAKEYVDHIIKKCTK